MNRIETLCKLDFAFLRECAGPISRNHANLVVVGEEIAPDGQVVRTWFLVLGEQGDGACLPNTIPPHTIVGTDIRPGEPTPPPIPGIQLKATVDQAQLLRLRKERVEHQAAKERHTIYCQQVLDDRAKLVTQAEQIEQLESQLFQADATTRELSTRNSDQASTIHGLNDALSAGAERLRMARKRKTLLYRVQLRGRTWCRRYV